MIGLLAAHAARGIGTNVIPILGCRHRWRWRSHGARVDGTIGDGIGAEVDVKGVVIMFGTDHHMLILYFTIRLRHPFVEQ